MSPAAPWMGMAALALNGCGKLLDIDTIEPTGSGGAGASTTSSTQQGGDGGGGGAGGGGGEVAELPATVLGRGCVVTDTCGPDGASCCESRLVEGEALGEFRMGCSFIPGRPCSTQSEGPEHSATVGNVYLDTFEGTVGRFLQFEEEYGEWRDAGNPAEGAGAHPRIPKSGWKTAWNEHLPTGSGDIDSGVTGFGCDPAFESWAHPYERSLPQNCLSWPMAFAFCIWSGGRLPTEAEWEMAATGGDENRMWAWGIDKPAPNLAVYNVEEINPPDAFWLDLAGSRPAGVGRFGHHDLSGSVVEWTLDQYSETWFKKGGAGNPCNDCANLGGADEHHSGRGGGWVHAGYDLTVTDRISLAGLTNSDYAGVRCARDGAP